MIPETLHVRSGRIVEFVGDDEYPLQLMIKHLRDLQADLNSGPSAILARLQTGAWMVDDIIEPIRHGLRGGGMSDAQAKALVNRYVVDGALIQYQPVALKVILAALIGNEDDMPDLGEPEAPTKMTTDDNLSDGQPTSSSPEPLDTPQEK
jgi:hypothetical protein